MFIGRTIKSFSDWFDSEIFHLIRLSDWTLTDLLFDKKAVKYYSVHLSRNESKVEWRFNLVEFLNRYAWFMFNFFVCMKNRLHIFWCSKYYWTFLSSHNNQIGLREVMKSGSFFNANGLTSVYIDIAPKEYHQPYHEWCSIHFSAKSTKFVIPSFWFCLLLDHLHWKRHKLAYLDHEFQKKSCFLHNHGRESPVYIYSLLYSVYS